MALVESLLTAIVRADGDALVMHVGEKPYVVASAGPIELSTQGLNLEAMVGMLTQLLPAELQRALAEFGAVEHELPSTPAMDGDRFTVVAARGGDDVWIEMRRHRRPRVSVVSAAKEGVLDKSVAPPAVVQSVAPAVAAQAPPSFGAAGPAVAAAAPVAAQAPGGFGDEGAASGRPDPPSSDKPGRAVSQPEGPNVGETSPAPVPVPHVPPVPPVVVPTQPPSFSQVSASVAASTSKAMPDKVAGTPDPEPAAAPLKPQSVVGVGSPSQAVPQSRGDARSTSAPPHGGEVIPMTRTVRIDLPPQPQRPPAGPSHIERLLGIAAARGAAALYLTSQSRPFLRVDDDVRMLEGEGILTSTDVESAVLELMPETTREALRRGDPAEWVSDLADVGRVRCSTFRDYRGPGAIFQLISVRPLSAEQLGLSSEMQALATEAEGLVLVASPRGAGKSTLVGAFVDLINRQRTDYVISLERQIRQVHENRSALISQREVRGTAEQVLTVARGALRENPDVLVIEDLPSADMFQLALEAAGSGLLVFATVAAGSTTAALTRVLELFPPDRRKAVQALVAERLRGAVAQVLLRKAGGGRVAARELLLTTASIASILSDGQLSDLPLAIDGGRRHGMTSLNDALFGFIRAGVVDVREAYRKADEREALLVALKREKIDTSVVERLA